MQSLELLPTVETQYHIIGEIISLQRIGRAVTAEVLKVCPYCRSAIRQPTQHAAVSIGTIWTQYYCVVCATQYFHLGDRTVAMVSELQVPIAKRITREPYMVLYDRAVTEEWNKHVDLEDTGVSEGAWTMAVEVAAQLYIKTKEGKAPGTCIGDPSITVDQAKFIEALTYLKQEGYIYT